MTVVRWATFSMLGNSQGICKYIPNANWTTAFNIFRKTTLASGATFLGV